MDFEDEGILEAEENKEIEYVFEEPQPKINNTTGEEYLNALGLNEELKSERKVYPISNKFSYFRCITVIELACAASTSPTQSGSKKVRGKILNLLLG